MKNSVLAKIVAIGIEKCPAEPRESLVRLSSAKVFLGAEFIQQAIARVPTVTSKQTTPPKPPLTLPWPFDVSAATLRKIALLGNKIGYRLSDMNLFHVSQETLR